MIKFSCQKIIKKEMILVMKCVTLKKGELKNRKRA